MAAGRIQNRGLIQTAADALNLEGVTRFPSTLDLSDIKAVYDIGQITSPRTDIIRQGDIGIASGPVVDVSAVANGILAIIGPFPASFAGISSQLSSATSALDSKVRAASFRLQFDAAGAVAFAGNIIDFFLRYDNAPGGGLITNIFTGIFTIDAAITQYNITLGGYPAVDATSGGSNRVPLPWDGFVPHPWTLAWLIQTRGPVFPANTIFSARVAAGQSIKGSPLR